MLVLGVLALYLFPKPCSYKRALLVSRTQLLVVFEGAPWVETLAMKLEKEWRSKGRHVVTLPAQEFTLEHKWYKGSEFVLCLIGAPPLPPPILGWVGGGDPSQAAAIPGLPSGSSSGKGGVEKDIYAPLQDHDTSPLAESILFTKIAVPVYLAGGAKSHSQGEACNPLDPLGLTAKLPYAFALYPIITKRDLVDHTLEAKKVDSVSEVLSAVFKGLGKVELLPHRECKPIIKPIEGDLDTIEAMLDVDMVYEESSHTGAEEMEWNEQEIFLRWAEKELRVAMDKEEVRRIAQEACSGKL